MVCLESFHFPSCEVEDDFLADLYYHNPISKLEQYEHRHYGGSYPLVFCPRTD